MDHVIVKILDWTDGRKALLALAAYLINVFLLSLTDTPLLALSNGQNKPDLTFGYNLQTLSDLFASYGEEGRSLYRANLIIDTPFPLILATATILMAAYSLTRNPKVLALLSIAPAAFTVLDLIENPMLYVLVSSYPDLSPPIVMTASLVTRLKLTAVMVTYPTLAVGIMVASFMWIRQRINRSKGSPNR